VPGETHAIIGRAAELEDVDGFLRAVTGGPAALVLEGEPGIGKSAVWLEGVAAASGRGYACLVCRPIEAETQLAYAALADLLDGVPGERLAALPPPQRRALEVALLRREPEGEASLQRAIAVGMLGVLRGLAADSPTVIAIDDAQWLDQPSERALAFVARRLGEERIGVLATSRAATSAPASLDLERALPPGRLRRLRLGPLDDEELQQILGARLSVSLPRRSFETLRETAGGNPFYALEIGRVMAEQPPGTEGRGTPLPETLSGLVGERLASLSPAARAAAETASALSRPELTQIAALLGEDEAVSAVGECVAAGVLEFDGERVRFAHPLLASVTYGELAAPRRRDLHRRLAELSDDAEERGRHLALGAEGPDAGVAAALDEAAARARARGAPDTAAELLERAYELTPAGQAAGAQRRIVGAAERRFEAGDAERAAVLLEAAVASAAPGTERARALSRLGWVRCHLVGFYAGDETFGAALAQAPDDAPLVIEIHEGLAWCSQSTTSVPEALAHARTALELAEQLDDPTLLAGALSSLSFLEALTGRSMPLATIERAVALGVSPEWSQILGRPDWIHGLLLEWDGRLEEARALFDRQHRDAVEHGDEHSLPFVLFHLARLELLLGSWEQARFHSIQARQSTVQSGQAGELAYSLLIEALVEAHLGDVDAARDGLAEGLELASRSGTQPAAFEMLATLGFLELSLGDHAAAADAHAQLREGIERSGLREPALFRFHGDALEALVALGRLDDAEDVLRDLDEMRENDWSTAMSARGRALLLSAGGDLAGACEELERGLQIHERLGQPFEQARTLLVVGNVERRRKQKRAAREALEGALRTFEELGARLWAERARGELARIGGRPSEPTLLTPTEARVAELIAQGHTYRETADALFISPKTVQWNLSKVYRKLGIRSRAELPARLAAARDDEPAG
jgi:DNA-binding CsgD family transcriptional regulator